MAADASNARSMTALDLLLLAVAIAGALARPRGVPAWTVPVAAAVVSVLIGSTDEAALRAIGDLLADPLLFLLAAVPLAALLDRLGFFAAAAGLARDGAHLELALWVLAGGVTVVLNLDAAVVLLTPLYIRIARASGRDAAALAFIPALQACLASSALPVSNLTNLLAAEHLGLDATGFVTELGAPTLAATAVGYVAYRRLFPPVASTAVAMPVPDRRALGVGGGVIAAVLVGFLLSDPIGVPMWTVVAAADVVLLGVLRIRPRRRDLPLDTAALALALGVVATAAARHVDIGAAIGDGHGLGELRVAAIGAAGAAGLNNLPAAIVGVTAIPSAGTEAVWPLLLGVNIGALLLVTGSLSNLLWQRAAADAGVPVSARAFTRVGCLVALPALLAAVAVRLVLP